MSTAQVAGLVLAGGQALRMGGADKGLQLLRGRTLLEWTIRRLSPQVMTVLISANDVDKYANFGLPVIADEPNLTGPLAGVHAGLKAARHPLVVTVPCDTPFLPMDLVSRLLASLELEQADLAIARTRDGRQPVFSLLRRRVLPTLEFYLHGGGRKADGWHGGLRIAEVSFDDNPAAFINVNTPEELRAINMSATNSSGADENS